MIFSREWVALGGVVLLLGCGGGTDQGGGVGEEIIIAEPAQEPGLAPGAAVGTNQVGSGQTVQMHPLRDSGVAGEATITDRGDQIEVMVRLTGTPNNTHPGHIHSGNCEQIGGVVQPLEPITTDSIGTGTMTTEVQIAPGLVRDGNHAIVYHGAGGAPITCGEIPASAM